MRPERLFVGIVLLASACAAAADPPPIVWQPPVPASPRPALEPARTAERPQARAEAVLEGRRAQGRVTTTPALPPRASSPPRPPAAAPTLEDFRFRSYPGFTRIVLETSAPVSYRVEHNGPGEARVRVSALVGEPRTEDVADGFISELRVERAGADLVVRVLYEGPPATLKDFALVEPHRLVLDFRRTEAESATKTVPQPLRSIVLDPGHGGHDSGAVGPTGLMEKDLVLDVANRVKKLVEADLGVRVLLTREADSFVTLRDRTSLANRERADLFVSIHANGHRQSWTEGVETFFLSGEASDSEARQLAALENSAVQLEKAAARGDVDPVKAILWDLAQSEFQVESSRLAEIVQETMSRSLRIPNRGVKQAGFYVLGGAAMPAILIEIGFVTNPREARKLHDPRYRDEIAHAIFHGLAEYKRYWDRRMRTTVERAR